MNSIHRRNFGLGLMALGTTAACGNGIGGNGSARIDARVDATLAEMAAKYPGTNKLRSSAAGMLVMPLMTEAGLGLGGGFGRGALRVQDFTVDYYSATSASAGLQIGAQQYAHVLFFMTQDALRDFRSSRGWALGANAEFTILETAETLQAETTTALSPVIAVIFAQAGLRLGATIEGVKYTRIIP